MRWTPGGASIDTDSRTSVLDEFERALEALREQPEAGARYQRCGVRNVRRVRLHGTPYLLFYHFEPGGEVLSVVAIWSGMRGFGPAMGRR